ncbi:MAG: polysaccharide biosynthesis tyrosine autokinase [Anaerolineae bacterium]
MVGNAIDDPNPTSAQFSTGRQLASTYVDIAGRSSVRSAAAEALGLDYLWQDIIVRQLNDTNLIDIIVTDTDPYRAQAVANELVRQLILRSPAGQESEDQAFVDELLQNYADQITETKTQLAAKREELGQAVGAREIADIQAEIDQMDSALRNLSTDYASLRSSTVQGATNTIRVIEPATLPRNPINPDNSATILMASGIGFVLAAAAAYVLEYLDDSVRTPEALARLTQLPILTGITNIRSGDEGQLVTMSQPRSPVSEAFRVLRTAVQFTALDQSNQVLLVTSASGGDGKSVISSNLAVVMAQAGHQVLLVDTDLRRPTLHTIFSLPNKRGLTSMLLEYRGDEEDPVLSGLLENTVQETQVDGLQVLTCGPIPPNPSELLGSNKMRDLLNVLMTRFDFVVLDSPPTLSVTDAVVLSAQSHGVIMVARAGKTRKNSVKQATERLRDVNARLIGCVLNLMDNKDGLYGMYYYDDPYMSGEAERTAETGTKGLLEKLRKRLTGQQHAA